MTLTSNLASFMFKQMFAEGFDERALVRKKPLSQWMEKREDFSTSEGYIIPAKYVHPQGVGPTAAVASANVTSSKGVKFTCPQRSYYAYGKIEGKVVRNAKNAGGEAAFVNAFEGEVDGCMESISCDLHRTAYGDKSAIRSNLSATGAINTTSWFLANVEDAQLYEVGMKVVPVNPATGLARAGTAVTINSVVINDTSAFLVCSGNPDTFTSAAVGDGIARDGFVGLDYDGLAAWCPLTVASSGDSFNGVDRYPYRYRLAGVPLDISGTTMREGFIKVKGRVAALVGTMFDTKAPFFMHPSKVAQIKQSVESSKVVDIELSDKYDIGIEAVKIEGHTIIEDSMCPVNTAWVVAPGAFVRLSNGDQPAIQNLNGTEDGFVQNNETDHVTFLMVHDGNFAALEPYNIARVALPTTPL